jgi:hypothetical protein
MIQERLGKLTALRFPLKTSRFIFQKVIEIGKIILFSREVEQPFTIRCAWVIEAGDESLFDKDSLPMALLCS